MIGFGKREQRPLRCRLRPSRDDGQQTYYDPRQPTPIHFFSVHIDSFENEICGLSAYSFCAKVLETGFHRSPSRITGKMF
jgi:hypothetical protein